MTFYNENEPYAAQWLRNLIKAGEISEGIVDERSIERVKSEHVGDAIRAHFFAGIAGWDLALQLAGWPAGQPVWTASLPCQPFSVAGNREGGEDDRHLWPVFFSLVRECRPDTIFGEQVEAAIGHGWLDRVFSDLEGEGYACGATIAPAASVGAPHGRHRIFWVAESGQQRAWWARCMGNSTNGRWSRSDRAKQQEQGSRKGRKAWAEYESLPCLDGKSRRIEPGTFPLAHGIPARVGKLRAYGNAIVPQVAAEFVRAFMEASEITRPWEGGGY